MRGAQSRHGGLEFNYYVYILRTADRQLYVGQTRGLGFRWAQHVSGSGAWFLIRHKPVAVELVLRCRTRKEALELEDFWRDTLVNDRDSEVIGFLGQVAPVYRELFSFVQKHFTQRA